MLLVGHACAGKRAPGTLPGDSDAGDAGDAGGDDAGDGGPSEAGCTSDSACGASRWCEHSTGICRDAKPCPQGQGNCDYQGFGPDYCGDQACYCDPADQSCKPLHLPCTACTASAQCGDDELAFNYASDCVPPDAGFADGSACIPRRDSYSGCPPGYATPAAGAYCIPNGGRCGGVGACTSDSQCDPHSATPICNAPLGLCVGACTFDLKTGESPACPAGQVCHLTPTLATLPPQDPNYARGRCGDPCTAATACGEGLVCSEGIDHPAMRCGLPPPECLGDVECPDSPSTNSWGYCDESSHACKTDCRTNLDCHPGFICSGNACVSETCLQAGGASLACDYGQFCCGEAASPAPCPSGVDGGACYDKPGGVWCGTCSKDDDCKTSAYPARAGNRNMCLDDGNGHKYCALGCDVGQPAECPRSWQCQNIHAGCSQDSDCGDQAGAHCDLPGDGGTGLCGCSGDSNCPSGTNCRSQECVFSSVCHTACP